MPSAYSSCNRALCDAATEPSAMPLKLERSPQAATELSARPLSSSDAHCVCKLQQCKCPLYAHTQHCPLRKQFRTNRCWPRESYSVNFHWPLWEPQAQTLPPVKTALGQSMRATMGSGSFGSSKRNIVSYESSFEPIGVSYLESSRCPLRGHIQSSAGQMQVWHQPDFKGPRLTPPSTLHLEAQSGRVVGGVAREQLGAQNAPCTGRCFESGVGHRESPSIQSCVHFVSSKPKHSPL